MIVARAFQRALAAIFLVAWLSLVAQLGVLMSSRGLLPAADFMHAVRESGGRPWQFPTMFWLGASDAFLYIGAFAGAALSLYALVGRRARAAFAVLVPLYLSYVIVGQTFFSFQWDNLLLECGACALFLRRDRRVAWTVWLFRLLLFKLYFESGIAKWQSHLGDWRDGSAMTFYYETAPLPTWLASYAHALPAWWHHFESWATLALELIVPFGAFGPRAIRLPTAALLTAFQLVNLATANYGFFVWLALALHLFLLDDSDLDRARAWLRKRLRQSAAPAPEPAPAPARDPIVERATAIVTLAIFSIVSLADATLSFADLQPPVRDAVAFARLAWSPWRLVNTYHLFGHITRERIEPQVELSDGHAWTEYDFRRKAGDPARAPGFVAPHQPRVDFQLWFYGLSYRHGMPRWVATLLERLCHDPAAVEDLFARPLPPHPAGVRLVFYRYHFSRAPGAWWEREPVDVTETLRCRDE